jgi:hypothetical protein
MCWSRWCPVLVLMAMMLHIVPASAQQADATTTAKASIGSLIADSSVQSCDISKAEKRQPPDEWRDQAKNVLCLAGPNAFRGGYVITNPTGEKLLDFMSPWPVPPVPMALMPMDEAKKIALDFAKRHLPELAAAGGEVTCTVSEKIAPYGAYLVACQRLQQGVQVPTSALVGVRVYDGKVVRWKPEHTPMTADLSLKVTKEQAQASASANLPGNTLEPVSWLEATPKVVVTQEGQRCVWDLWAELKTKNSREPNILDFIGHWQIDAGEGKVLRSEALQPTKELYFWYASKGGKHIPFPMGKPNPDEICRDWSPTPSPDGKRILFLSYRPRDGYPQWMAYKPWSLFVVNRDGSGLRNLPALEPTCPSWSPDGSSTSWLEKSGIKVRSLPSGQETLIAPADPLKYVHYTWTPSGKILAVGGRYGTPTSLYLLDPSQPTASPVELPKFIQPVEKYARVIADSKGTVFLVVETPPKPPVDNDRMQNPYRLLKLDLSQAEPKAEEAMPYVAGSQGLQWMPDGKLLVQGVRIVPWVAIDTIARTEAVWKPPQVLQPDRYDKRAVSADQPQNIVWSNGEMLFSAQYFTGKDGDAPGKVIYACQPDGSKPRLITRPDTLVVAP